MNGVKLIELKQERATVTNSIRTIMTEFENKEIDAIKKDEMAKFENRFDEINNLIIKEEKQLNRERTIGENQNDTDKTKDKGKVDEMRAAFTDYIRNGNKASFEIYNALQQSVPTQAGNLVAPEKFVMELIKELDNNLFIRQKCKVLPALQGAQSLGYPKRTTRMGAAIWGTEISAPTPDTALAFGKKEFKPNPATAEILLSKTLIRNAPEVDGIVRAEMAMVFGELLETAYLKGTGVGQPLGLFTASANGISVARDVSTGNTATALTFDGLIEAKYSVKDQYQKACEWIFHRDAIKQIAKIKDLEGQYIWQPSLIIDRPDMLLGKAMNSSEYAPNVFTAGLYAGLYGDLKNYWICDSLAMEMQVLMELYARTNQVDYIARLETDGMPVLEEAFARIKLAAV